MPHDLMLECEKRTLFKRGEAKVWAWKRVLVADLMSGAAFPDIRCAHCHGRIRVHRRHAESGPQDHVEHSSHQDSEGCRGGHYFLGSHRLSSSPVL